MDTLPLVERQIEDGERLLNRLAEDGVAVDYAYWGKRVEEDRWSLNIATPIIDERGLHDAYRTVYDALRAFDDLSVGESDIKLVRPNDPSGAGVREVRGWFTHTPIRWRPGKDEAEAVRYIYPETQGVQPQASLDSEQKQFLTDLYFGSGRPVDDLPYTPEMEEIYKEFVNRTGLTLTIRDVFKALMNLRKQGRLSRRTTTISLPA